jgi:probable phosphoglycerate mutase
MLKIYLTRHGQDEDNVAGILNGHRNKPLTARGVKQGEELATKIKKAGLKFEAIYSSPLKRAYQTALIISKKLALKRPKKLADLIERDFGKMTGKKSEDVEKLCLPSDILKTKTITYFLSHDSGETFPQALKRAKNILAFIKKEHKGGSVLLVSHGDFGKMIFAAYYKLPWKKVLKLFHFGNDDLLLLSKNTKLKDAYIFKTKQYNL